MLAIVFVLAAGAAGPSCDVAASPAREVAAVATGIIEADNARALERVLAFYAPSAVLLPPGQPPVAGFAAIRPRYEAMFAAFTPELSARVDEACASGALAYVRGHNRGRLVSRGGGSGQVVDDPYLTCHPHNRLLAELEYGKEVMARYARRRRATLSGESDHRPSRDHG